jgi:hypothetical protein
MNDEYAGIGLRARSGIATFALSLTLCSQAAVFANTPVSFVMTPVTHTSVPHVIVPSTTVNHSGLTPNTVTNTHTHANTGSTTTTGHTTTHTTTHTVNTVVPTVTHLSTVFAPTSTQHATASKVPGYQLDLTSSNANIVLGSNLFKGVESVTINVGGTAETFKAGASVTPSEYLLIQQTLTNSSSQLVLNSKGVADGGSFSLNGRTETTASEIIVAKGVTAIDNVTGKALKLSGELLNYGSIDAVSLNSANKTANIDASEIVNEKGGVISSQLSNLATITPGALSNLGLALQSTDTLTNSGLISSAGGGQQCWRCC